MWSRRLPVLTGQPGNGKTTISKLIVQAYRVAALKGSTALAANHDAVLTGPGQSFSDNWVAQRGDTDYSRLEHGEPVEL